MGLLELGLDQGPTDRSSDWDNPDLAVVPGASPQPATRVVLFLADRCAHRRIHFLPRALGDRPSVSQVRTLATKESSTHCQPGTDGATGWAEHSPRAHVLDGCRGKNHGLKCLRHWSRRLQAN